MSDRWWRSKKANEAAAARERIVNRIREADRLAKELNWAESRPGDGRVVIIPGGPDWRAKVIESEAFAERQAELPEIGVQNKAEAEARYHAAVEEPAASESDRTEAAENLDRAQNLMQELTSSLPARGGEPEAEMF